MKTLRIYTMAAAALFIAGAALAQRPVPPARTMRTAQPVAPPAPPPRPPIRAGTYHCRGFFNARLESLSFSLMGDGKYRSLNGEAEGTYEFKDGKLFFYGGHLSGEVGTELRDDSVKLGVERCVSDRY